MNEPITDQTPCRNGCVAKGTEENDEPVLLVAAHGAFCDQCFSRLAYPLRIAADLAEHITSRVAEKGSAGDESMVKTTKSSAPLPMNEGAFTDVNEMYETLAYLARYFAKRLGVPAPTPATRAWRSEAGHIKGFPSNVTPTAARYQTAALSTWLDARLNALLEVIDGDDFEGVSGRLGTVAAMGARHPMKMRPRYSVMTHNTPSCEDGRIAIYPPRRWKDQPLIVCESCGLVYSENTYLRALAEWREDKIIERRKVNREKAAAARRTADHLAAKYAGDLMLTMPALDISSVRRQREYELIRDAVAEAALDVPPAGVLVIHHDGVLTVTTSHTVKAGEIQHMHEAGSGTLPAPVDQIRAS